MERHSARILTRLTRAPRFVLPVLSAALLLAGLGLPPLAGLVFFVLLVALVGWLSYLSWPVTRPPARALRVVVLLLILGAAVRRLL